MSKAPDFEICMVIGDPISHSLSPAMHNAAYASIQLDTRYVYVRRLIDADHLPACIEAVRTLGIRGVSCTSPHKIAVMELLDEIDPVASKIGAVNTVVNQNGHLSGYNTDWLGIVLPLQQLLDLTGKKVALIGAGGAARSALYGLLEQGANVTIYNRTLSHANRLADEFNVTAKPIAELTDIEADEVIIDAASRTGSDRQALDDLIVRIIKPEQIFFNVSYGPTAANLMTAVQQKGAIILNGLDMLLYQGAEQFRLFTGHPAPVEVMREALSHAAAPGAVSS